MNRIIIISFCFLASFTCLHIKAQVFVIERGSSFLTYKTIGTAINALQDDDILYIPPGVHDIAGMTWKGYNGAGNFTNTLAITKKVTIIGAGYWVPDKSSTIANSGSGVGVFVLTENASGSVITGIRFETELRFDHVSNIQMDRCGANQATYFGGTGENNILTECTFSPITKGSSSYRSGGSGVSVVANKCTFWSTTTQFHSSTVWNSNFFMISYSNNNYFVADNSYFWNNIFIHNDPTNVLSSNRNFGLQQVNNSVFNNNLWVSVGAIDSHGSNTFTKNMTATSVDNVFTNYSAGDYRLLSTCVGKNAGTDGTDVGIYGTQVPFKTNRLPFVPHIIMDKKLLYTDGDGKLPVNITIEAQEN